MLIYNTVVFGILKNKYGQGHFSQLSPFPEVLLTPQQCSSSGNEWQNTH